MQLDPILDALRAALGGGERNAFTVDNRGGVAVPHVLEEREHGWVARSLEQALARPARSRGVVVASTWSNFADLVEELGSEAVRIYYTDDGEMRAVLNDDTPGTPGWRDWTVDYVPVKSEAWIAWNKASGQLIPQIAAAEFIQERVADFVEPPGASMLELAQQFDVHRTGRFASGVRIGAGHTKLVVEEEAAAKGEIQIPNTVKLGMRVFDDLDAYSFGAYFRWRIKESALTLGFKLVDPREVQRRAVADLVARVKSALPSNGFYAVAQLPTPTK